MATAKGPSQRTDQFPKMNLYDGYLGDGYPLCEDAPAKAHLRKGATYLYLGSAPGAFVVRTFICARARRW